MSEITAEMFRQHVCREPKDDDLERCNCAFAGQVGHRSCGWDWVIMLPRWEAQAWGTMRAFNTHIAGAADADEAFGPRNE